MQAVILSYKLKLFPSRCKADTLALLAALFERSHAACTLQLRQEEGKPPSTKGMGEFVGRAYRRAYIDYRRITKAGHTPGFLKAELIDSADLQQPKQARGFDYWILLKGTKDKLYIPARGHRALNRALALPGAELNLGTKGSAYVMRKNGKWYAYVTVSVPLAEVQAPKGWLGCDVGARAAVVRSDGYKGPDLRPVIQRTKQRKADQQRNGIDRQTITHQRQILSREARKAVSVASRSRRGLALEDPRRLPRWKQWAGRQFASRVQLLASVVGVPVALVPPPYTSLTCSSCGWAEKRQRHKETFRCWQCGYTHNADFNASRNISRRAHGYCHSQLGSLSLCPRGGGADG